MLGLRISAAIRFEYVVALFSQPISALDRMPKGSPTDLITNSANTVQIGISDKLALLFQSIALVVTAYVVAFKYSWQLTLASSSCLLFTLIAYFTVGPLFIKYQHRIDHADEKASTIASDVFGSIRTVLSLGAENDLNKRYVDWVEEAQKRSKKVTPLVGTIISSGFFATYCNFALSFWFGIKLYSQGIIPGVGTLIT
jgi:ATP-binding cassette, subfamily B (MDR/TAP), member 1